LHNQESYKSSKHSTTSAVKTEKWAKIGFNTFLSSPLQNHINPLWKTASHSTLSAFLHTQYLYTGPSRTYPEHTICNVQQDITQCNQAPKSNIT